MEEHQVPELPAEIWDNIRRFLDAPEMVALARTSKELHKIFGGLLFVHNQKELDTALAFQGEAQAIVLLPAAKGLMVERVPASGVPIVSFGSNTAITTGLLFVNAPVDITISGDATVLADGGATVEASGHATVHAYPQSTVTASGHATVHAYPQSTVTASGHAFVDAHEGATVTVSDHAKVTTTNPATVIASGNARVAAREEAQVTAHGSKVLVFWYGTIPSNNLHVDDPTTVRRIEEGDLYLPLQTLFQALEARYPAPTPATEDMEITDNMENP